MSWSSRQSIAEPLIEFWSELRTNIHPRDADVFTAWSGSHSLNIDYPPPAYIGDVRQARVFILWANGGFDPDRTAIESPNEHSKEKFRERLRNPRAWASLKFKKQSRLCRLLENGQAAIVNAMAYRSRKISEELENQAMAERLPSVRKHREWLRSFLLPACGNVMIIVHRPNLWKLKAKSDDNKFCLFTHSAGLRYLPNWVLDEAEEFLGKYR